MTIVFVLLMNIRCHHHSHLRLGRTGYLGQRQRGSTCPQSHWFGTIRLTLHHQLTRSRNFLLGLSARVLKSRRAVYITKQLTITPTYTIPSCFPLRCVRKDPSRVSVRQRDSDWSWERDEERDPDVRLTFLPLFTYVVASRTTTTKRQKIQILLSLNLNLYLYFWLFSAFYFWIDNHSPSFDRAAASSDYCCDFFLEFRYLPASCITLKKPYWVAN